MKVALGRIASVAGLLLVWEGVTRAGLADPDFLAPPLDVARQVVVLASRPDVQGAYAGVGLEIALAFALAVIVGIPLGVALGLSTYLYRVFNPILVMLFGIPQITVLPVFILFLGIGASSKIAFGFTHAVFPILFTCIAGCRSVDGQLLRAALAMGATRGQLFWHLVAPSILPSIATGLRLGMAANLLGVLLAELFVSQKGVGYFVHQFTATFRAAEMYGIVGTLALFAILVNELLRAVEQRLSAWRA
jgi:ABC-type nitrate/sulfonate/bicarbonate transport system permease component